MTLKDEKIYDAARAVLDKYKFDDLYDVCDAIMRADRTSPRFNRVEELLDELRTEELLEYTIMLGMIEHKLKREVEQFLYHKG